MKKILLSLTTLLFLFTNSAYSVPLTIKDLNGKPKTNADGSEVQIELKETEDIRVEQIVVPENERWMVERVLAQNPDLKEGDISRVEYSFGVYYGQISRKTPRVADGKGILGVSIDDTDYYGIETTFKYGKLGRKSEQKILTTTLASVSGTSVVAGIFETEANLADEIKFYNQAFNNGFKIKADLIQLLKHDVSNTLESFLDEWENPDGVRKPWTFYNAMQYNEIDNEFKRIQSTLLNPELSERDINSLKYYIDNVKDELDSLQRNYISFIEREAPSIDTSFLGGDLKQNSKNNKDYNLGDILRSAYVKDQIGRLENMISNLGEAEDILNVRKDVVTLLKFQEKSLKASDSLETLKSAQGFLDKENDFKELRIVEAFNMRKNTSGESIEALANNGKWYEIEYVLNDDAFQLTDDSKKYYENDKKALQTGSSDSSSSSSSSGSGDGGGGEGGGS